MQLVIRGHSSVSVRRFKSRGASSSLLSSASAQLVFSYIIQWVFNWLQIPNVFFCQLRHIHFNSLCAAAKQMFRCVVVYRQVACNIITWLSQKCALQSVLQLFICFFAADFFHGWCAVIRARNWKGMIALCRHTGYTVRCIWNQFHVWNFVHSLVKPLFTKAAFSH